MFAIGHAGHVVVNEGATVLGHLFTDKFLLIRGEGIAVHKDDRFVLIEIDFVQIEVIDVITNSAAAQRLLDGLIDHVGRDRGTIRS